ncbi:hypothetical protein C4D60_Mb07t23000 [Musa balbisiana]|uniref:Uncharacterized protein n=1 Tax=Musa balbisiana TaxID=52838 RepID=A0A4S8JHL4_MUSBA|nr:hypothetical protein C4D60_Mb07t23000 [Musa balbisiana]
MLIPLIRVELAEVYDHELSQSETELLPTIKPPRTGCGSVQQKLPHARAVPIGLLKSWEIMASSEQLTLGSSLECLDHACKTSYNYSQEFMLTLQTHNT